MKTLAILLAFACAITNTLLFAAWLTSGEAFLAGIAGLLALLCAALAVAAAGLRTEREF